MNLLFQCPVCGWSGLEKKQFFPYSTHEICACCGTQFGLDVVNDEDINKVRSDWLEDGAPWFDDAADISPAKPSEWNINIAKNQIMTLQ